MASYQQGWALVMTGAPPVPTLLTTNPPVATNPFGALGPPPTFQTITVRSIIDSARLRHWAFSDLEMGDGAALLFLNQRQREHLAKGASMIEGLVGTAIQYAVSPAPQPGLFVSFSNGGPYVAATNQDGWAIHTDINGVPFVDPTEPQIPADPLAQSGGVQGFPLPQDMIRLINVMLVYNSSFAGGAAGPNQGTFIPCTVTDERQRNAMLPGRDPVAFIAANRLIPMLRQPGIFPNSVNTANQGDRWYSIMGIQISYVGMDTLRSLDDEITLPVILCGALIADTALLFANASKLLNPAERASFAQAASAAGQEINSATLDLLDSPQLGSVRYTGR